MTFRTIRSPRRNWPALAHIWHLDLHDNVIGNEGLIALAKSTNLGRLLELDLKDSADFDTLNILVEALTPEISGLVYNLMQECAFMLLPMAIAASVEAAQTVDCDWPKVKVVASAAELHELLVRGPFSWWKHK